MQATQLVPQSENFKVMIRVRPLAPRESEEIAFYDEWRSKKGKGMVKSRLSSAAYAFYSKYYNAQITDMLKFTPNTLSIFDSQYKNSDKKLRDYVYSRVFSPSQSTLQLYNEALKEQVQNVLEGYNCTVLAYGITGSGKTYTIFGGEEGDGLCKLAMRSMMDEKKRKEECGQSITMACNFIEIYNENIYDLLSEEPRKQLAYLSDTAPISSSLQLTSFAHFCFILQQGLSRRMFASTNSNEVSSRSHAILKIEIQGVKQGKSWSGRLMLVDLAGSEKLSMDDKIRKKEGININKSLLALGNCISALTDPKRSNHIPYRDSKLTRILKDSLAGNCKTIMIGCISPHPFTLEESIITLSYAQRAQGIKKQTSKNIADDEIQCWKCKTRGIGVEVGVGRDESEPQANELSNRSNKKSIKPFIHAKRNSIDIDSRSICNSHGRRRSVDNLHSAEQINTDVDSIFSDIIQRIYEDIIANVQQSEKIDRLRILAPEPCEQLNRLARTNQEERERLRKIMMSAFTQRKKHARVGSEMKGFIANQQLEPIAEITKKKIRIQRREVDKKGEITKQKQNSIKKQAISSVRRCSFDRTDGSKCNDFTSGIINRNEDPLTAQTQVFCDLTNVKVLQTDYKVSAFDSADKGERRKSRSKFEIVKKASITSNGGKEKRFITEYI